ncbi:SIR2 family protein [Paenibacillus radicis (ex Xue et al. 2023)]|uniref:SIR2 family protein n=1 Tax=Paenibacillus radicis (ex Xue et al. 2023) TaxID=2972489 RepID=A0ABT1YL68_9BACL|nr:SIR2 family protein [Paenibacillus radicis (ex Xue et al. 2023)]MCR8633918.1 SIR2 family protein [Paenibacillus radicis (ex Xue et al. 2023)]
MEKVVYILGAGFSAPLGLPVMSNFILKAKDLYFQDTERYSHFNEIFDLLNKMSVIKNFFKADLYNIEEILSILEMNDYLEGQNNTEKFKQFLRDVIEHYTPGIVDYNEKVSNWHDFVFGQSESNILYGHFVAELFNLKFEMLNRNDRIIKFKRNHEANTEYSVVTLNYDLVLENTIRYLNRKCDVSRPITFAGNAAAEAFQSEVQLSKLHGCIEKMNLVPPTWNKTSNQDLLETWKIAQKQLREANHVRILGYSLPISDSYMKYMLKSSLLESKHLKSIDVISLDPSGEVKQRFDDFIDFNYYRFKNGNIVDYLKLLNDITKNLKMYSSNDQHIHNHLERVHSEFMSSL